MLQRLIRLLKTSSLLVPILALIDFTLLLVDQFAIWTTTRPRHSEKVLLILRFDVLGDYLLFRNYLPVIRQSTTYRNYKLVFVGNVAVKTIAETFDKNLIDTFIWVDIYKLATRPLYRFRFVQQLRKVGADVVFCPTYSRVLVLDDFMARASGAAERIGCITDGINSKSWEANLGDKAYTRLIDSGRGFIFEMERNRRIVEGFLQIPVSAHPPKLNVTLAKPVELPTQFVVFSLGAGQHFRIWSPTNFANVANYIHQHYPNFQFVITGTINDQALATEFLAALSKTCIVRNLIGQLTLPQLVYTLAQATLLITNESGAVHLAASVGTSTITISQGKSLVRWHPYPATLGIPISYIYPVYIENHRSDLTAIATEFTPESRFSINEISVDQVLNKIAIPFSKSTI